MAVTPDLAPQQVVAVNNADAKTIQKIRDDLRQKFYNSFDDLITKIFLKIKKNNAAPNSKNMLSHFIQDNNTDTLALLKTQLINLYTLSPFEFEILAYEFLLEFLNKNSLSNILGDNKKRKILGDGGEWEAKVVNQYLPQHFTDFVAKNIGQGKKYKKFYDVIRDTIRQKAKDFLARISKKSKSKTTYNYNDFPEIESAINKMDASVLLQLKLYKDIYFKSLGIDEMASKIDFNITEQDYLNNFKSHWNQTQTISNFPHAADETIIPGEYIFKKAIYRHYAKTPFDGSTRLEQMVVQVGTLKDAEALRDSINNDSIIRKSITKIVKGVVELFEEFGMTVGGSEANDIIIENVNLRENKNQLGEYLLDFTFVTRLPRVNMLSSAEDLEIKNVVIYDDLSLLESAAKLVNKNLAGKNGRWKYEYKFNAPSEQTVVIPGLNQLSLVRAFSPQSINTWQDLEKLLKWNGKNEAEISISEQIFNNLSKNPLPDFSKISSKITPQNTIDYELKIIFEKVNNLLFAQIVIILKEKNAQDETIEQKTIPLNNMQEIKTVFNLVNGITISDFDIDRAIKSKQDKWWQGEFVDNSLNNALPARAQNFDLNVLAKKTLLSFYQNYYSTLLNDFKSIGLDYSFYIQIGENYSLPDPSYHLRYIIRNENNRNDVGVYDQADNNTQNFFGLKSKFQLSQLDYIEKSVTGDTSGSAKQLVEEFLSSFFAGKEVKDLNLQVGDSVSLKTSFDTVNGNIKLSSIFAFVMEKFGNVQISKVQSDPITGEKGIFIEYWAVVEPIVKGAIRQQVKFRKFISIELNLLKPWEVESEYNQIISLIPDVIRNDPEKFGIIKQFLDSKFKTPDLNNFRSDMTQRELTLIKAMLASLLAKITQDSLDLVNKLNEIFEYDIPEHIIDGLKHPDEYSAIEKIVDSLSENSLKDVKAMLNSERFIKIASKLPSGKVLEAFLKYIKNMDKTKYSYFGTGVALGLAGLGGMVGSLSGLRAKSLSNKASNNFKYTKIAPLVVSLMSLVGIVGGVVLNLIFFIEKGGF